MVVPKCCYYYLFSVAFIAEVEVACRRFSGFCICCQLKCLRMIKNCLYSFLITLIGFSAYFVDLFLFVQHFKISFFA